MVTGGSDGAEMVSIAEMMRLMLEDRKRHEEEITDDRRWREKEFAKERCRQREETEQRLQEMRKQMALLQRLVVERPLREAVDGRPALKLARLSEGDDIEAYLVTFERTMEAYEVDRARWSSLLAPQLTDRAQQTYAAMSAESARVYDELKAAILRRYNVTGDAYRQRFQTATLNAGEAPRELVTHLGDLAERWMKDCTTVEDIVDRIILEQLLDTLPEHVRLWVRERKPRTSEEAGQLADNYLQARGTLLPESHGPSPPGKCPRCCKYGHWARDCQKATYGGANPMQ